ncbi:GTP 3',8-cyclase MoaA [Sphingobium subterraneum]|uniref:GTP 3',8-cyclase n=1 Tax=Sphingobium subterraneum TaxID=627688 RepID=A0A841IU44_9SPHN|nr:GTP 3',8-cyclase MoaA [Sphingobium subterraneum]MBB6122439.1 cyclic pyranopterin phosphate synthase [Sphingobium subterraneum]
MTALSPSPASLVDGFGRRIDYLRISVTDRCDLRCRYCMAEKMTFLPRKDVLTLEEIAIMADRFIARGVRKIRLTGGEPLVRRDFGDLAHRIGRHLSTGALDELTLTTNGTRLAEHTDMLVRAGIRRINVSLDSLDPDIYRHITRGGDLAGTLAAMDVARRAGLAIKINAVALRGLNDQGFLDMLRWCDAQGHDLTLIETMPLGAIDEDRSDRYLPLSKAVEQIEQAHPLAPLPYRSGGPARYFQPQGMGIRLGLITPLSNNFCAGCNRMRLTCEGKIFMCLGHEDHIDLKAAFREGGADAIDALLDRALIRKPLAHEFAISDGQTGGQTQRHMSVTGG